MKITLLRMRKKKGKRLNIVFVPILAIILSGFGELPKWLKGRAWKARRSVTGR